jgi:ribosome-associated protein
LVTSRDRAINAVQAAIEKNALEPVLLEVGESSSYTDFILILSGRSMRQVEAIAEQIRQAMKSLGEDPVGVEGERGGHWMLLDYGDVVIHVFYHPMREYYDLEGLWSDAPRVQLDIPPELRFAESYL